MGNERVGINFQGLPILGNSLVHLTLLKESLAKVAVGLGIVGVDVQGLLEMVNCFVQLPLLKKANAKVAVGFHIVGVDLQGLLVRSIASSISPF